MNPKISIVIESDDRGFFAHCPALPGCHTQGETLDETLANIREAIELYLDTLSDDEKKELLSREILTTSMEFKVA